MSTFLIASASSIVLPLIHSVASDDDAISYVQFAVDAQLVATTSSAPREVTLDSSALPDGPATITATAVDRTGNAATSDPVTVTAPISRAMSRRR